MNFKPIKSLMLNSILYIIFTVFFVAFSCKDKATEQIISDKVVNESISKRVIDSIIDSPPEDMVWIPRGSFLQGAVPQDQMAMKHEKPQHPVTVDGFFMDITEVTNAQFTKFIEETSYITVAEREIIGRK